jgi:two-component system sensor kinase FixL
MHKAAFAPKVLSETGSSPALHQSELHFRQLLDKLPAGAYTCDAAGLITYFNPHAVKLWGRAPKLNDPVDRFCGSFRLFGSDGSPLTHDACWMALALKEEREYNGHEIIVQRADGERLTVLAHANPIRDESGNVRGAVKAG